MSAEDSKTTTGGKWLRTVVTDAPILVVVWLIGGTEFLKVFLGLIGVVVLIAFGVYAASAVAGQAEQGFKPERGPQQRWTYLVVVIGGIYAIYYVGHSIFR
ncbi:MAG: hypothetical protein ABL986_23855 [Vicinamibacterales bacterium]